MPTDPEHFKACDAGSYDKVADRFEYWTERVTSALAEELVQIADIHSGERVLDVGAGSGVVTFAAAQQVGAAGQIVGVDLSDGMLRVARSKILSPGNIQFQQMDAELLEFPPASFDAVLSLYAVLHFPRPETAIAEMFRVLRPEGRVVLGIGSDKKLSWENIAQSWSRLKESRKCLAAPKALDRFIEERLPKVSEHETHDGPAMDPLGKLLHEAGFRGIRRHCRSYTHLIESPADFWDLQITFSSRIRKRLQGAPREITENLRQEFCAKCNAFLATGGKLVYRNGAAIFCAIRP